MSKTVYSAAHEHLVQLLAEARKSAGLKQSDLADRIGRERTVISTIESGQRRVDVLEFLAIARALDLDPVALFARVAAFDGETGNAIEPLPEIAPELYETREDRNENAADFLNRVWGRWLRAGVLYQDQLRKLDPKLIDAIKSYCRNRELDPKDLLPPPRHKRTEDQAKDSEWATRTLTNQRAAARNYAARKKSSEIN